MDKYPAVARKRQHEVVDAERDIGSLIWRQDDREQMLLKLSELEAALKARGNRDGRDYDSTLKKLCATWTIQARYSTLSINFAEARTMLDRVRGLKELLK